MDNLKCGGFVRTDEKTSYGAIKNSCKFCGRTEEAHAPVQVVPNEQRIKIFFQGKFYEFDNWQKAREKGFYLY